LPYREGILTEKPWPEEIALEKWEEGGEGWGNACLGKGDTQNTSKVKGSN